MLTNTQVEINGSSFGDRRITVYEVNEYFVPQGESIYDKAVLKTIISAAIRELQQQLPTQIQRHDKDIHLTEHADRTLQRVGRCVLGIIANPDSLRLPDTNSERISFVKLLIQHCIAEDVEPIHLIAPVCPDYGEGEQFHSKVNKGIGKEADAAIHAFEILHKVFNEAEIDYRGQVLVADTETDHADILRRCANGDIEQYIDDCDSNVGLIALALVRLGLSKKVEATSFSKEIHPLFHETQYDFEKKIRQHVQDGGNLKHEISKIGNERKKRHSQILGREESDYELTIRYIAQYAALGKIVNMSSIPTVLMNYPTPNTRYYNLGIRSEFSVSGADTNVIPVLGSIIRRN